MLRKSKGTKVQISIDGKVHEIDAKDCTLVGKKQKAGSIWIPHNIDKKVGEALVLENTKSPKLKGTLTMPGGEVLQYWIDCKSNQVNSISTNHLRELQFVKRENETIHIKLVHTEIGKWIFENFMECGAQGERNKLVREMYSAILPQAITRKASDFTRVVLMGPSRAGKSTTINTIDTVLLPWYMQNIPTKILAEARSPFAVGNYSTTAVSQGYHTGGYISWIDTPGISNCQLDDSRTKDIIDCISGKSCPEKLKTRYETNNNVVCTKGAPDTILFVLPLATKVGDDWEVTKFNGALRDLLTVFKAAARAVDAQCIVCLTHEDKVGEKEDEARTLESHICNHVFNVENGKHDSCIRVQNYQQADGKRNFDQEKNFLILINKIVSHTSLHRNHNSGELARAIETSIKQQRGDDSRNPIP